MAFLDNEVREELKKVFSTLGENKVKVVFFKENINCQLCPQIEELLKEVSEISNNILLEVYNRISDEEKAKEYNVERTPAIFIETERTGKRVVFYGAPVGYEFVSFIEAIKNSVKDVELEEEVLKKLKGIDKDVSIKVFVTPTCPYCPSQVITAHKFAMVNEKIKGEMIEVSEYPDLASLYQVEGVPKTVINNKISLVGAQPEEELINAVVESIK